MSEDIQMVVESLADQYLDWWRPTSDGKNINGPCPFHQEKTAGAFYISTENGLFICHSCQTKGSLLTFLKEIGAPRSLRATVLDQVGETLFEKTKRRDVVKGREDPFKGHMALSEGLLGIFDYTPLDLVKAGFDKKVLQDYDIGFDKDAMRITFPIRNHLGVLMGIAGRTVQGDWPRYKIYKAEDLKRFSDQYRGYDIHKKNFLWNMDRVYPEAFHGDLDHMFIVEGYKAALWLIQNGAWNTVALQGTYLSFMQRRLLQRFGGDLILFLDNTDHAKKGVFEAGNALRSANKVRVCVYPEQSEEGDQPDDLDPESLVETLETAVDFHRWRRHYARLQS